jgi:DNA-binding CsgD family transcriptional regulator
MALLADRLVGRAEELGALDRLLDDLDRGKSAAVAVIGEPGIGKTRLLAELAGCAETRRHLVLAGSASELERDLPFWVFVDALEVARLVVDRKTNAQIAGALFLSHKTVESHIRNMFRKLSVGSRVELARSIERADRDGAA